MIAARQRLLELRASRIEQLLRVRVVLRGLLADFFETLDPVSNVRLAEITGEGSKSNGDLAITLSFFEGTRMQLSVDTTGRFHHSVSIPSAFDDVARIVEIGFSADMSRAELVYEPVDGGESRRLDLLATVLAMLAHAIASVEAEVGEVRPSVPVLAPVPARAVPTEAPASEAPVSRPAAVVPPAAAAAAAAAAAPSLRLTLAPVAPQNTDVLTFNVG